MVDFTNDARSEIVLQVGAEGGSLTMYRRRVTDRTWEYQSVTDESALTDLLEPGELVGWDPVRRGDVFQSFEEALVALDARYPWACLFPSEVHPEFRAAVLVAVEQRLAASDSPDMAERALGNWQRFYGGEIP